MSYILDALKKSEQARGNRKIRGLLEEPVEVAFIQSSKPPKSFPRWLYIVVFTLLLNAGFFAFRLRPWQWGGNANISSSRISGGPFPETRPQTAPVIAPEPLTQLQVKQEVAQSQPGDIVENKIPPRDQEAMQSLKTEPARADRAPAQPPSATPGVSRKDEVAVRKPDGSKPPQNPKAAGTKKGLKTANLEAAGKNQAVRVERPLRPAADSGIIADIEPLTGLGEFSGKPAARQEPKWYELAPQIRDALPNLSVSMLIYSKKPEDRWININGSKKREGEEISAGLKLEEITPDGAIFSYQGHRFYKGVVGD
jgi:hypothetical protein